MLFALRDYIAKEKTVTLEQLSRFFNMDTTALKPMLDVWIARGVLERHAPKKKGCTAVCQGCDSGITAELYSIS